MYAADELRRALRARPEPYRAVATRAGLSRPAISHFANNQRNLRAANLDAVAKAINCRIVLVRLDEDELEPAKTWKRRSTRKIAVHPLSGVRKSKGVRMAKG